MKTIWTRTVAVLVVVLAVSLAACSSVSIPETPKLESQSLQDLEQNRARMIEHLKAYAERGEFPRDPEGSVVEKNDPHYRDGKELKHRLIGPDGAHCALAYIMAQTGEARFIKKMSQNHNAFCVGMDLKGDKSFTEWILASGLTLEECILIQKPGDEDIPVEQNRREIRVHLTRVIEKLEEQQAASLQLAWERLTEEKAITVN